ncbi:NAD-dependent epimerase/dehydratase family protein [Candidatus Gracilibacteria bacterium]|nr:NAD-dependent epimerase/dehydratase family protein [Candidatus Gracilibacteria bacterium]
MKKIAVLGATGYIGRSLLVEFFGEVGKYELFLFSRSKEKLSKIVRDIPDAENYTLCDFSLLHKHVYDVVINCTGIGDTQELRKTPEAIFRVTEEIDNMILSYLDRKPKTLYINLSSGAVYGDNFNKAINEKTKTILNINNLKISEYYSIAKINAEAKHRSMSNLNVVDLRVFAFFSKFVDTKVGFLMSEIVECIKNKKVFKTNNTNIVRDYISASDLLSLIKLIIKKSNINDSFDVYSLKPISKFQLLSFLEKKYGLKYKINSSSSKENTIISKNIYYSNNQKAKDLGYKPELSSLKSISKELELFFEM